ncbi:MAG: 50S ribosomal protein L21e [Candidatus Nanoarchaeia archaeon]|nr:50S ribosomal protein L21e [Candidatus Nanoarchaeia archaeon]
MKRIGGFRRKTRYKLQKHYSQKGKVSIRRFLQSFKEGEHAVLSAEPAYQKGMYLPRFHGRNVIIKAKKGRCYVVTFKDTNKQKDLIVHPIHLKRC